MPQLMPLNWCASFMMVMFLFVMMMVIYFMRMGLYSFQNFKSYKGVNLNWKW